MRTWRIVTYLALAVLILCLVLVLSTPLRFPGYIIFSFTPILIFLVAPTAICALLIARLLLPHRTFSLLALGAALAFTLLTLAGYMAFVVLVGSLLAIALLFVASRSIELSQLHDAAAAPRA